MSDAYIFAVICVISRGLLNVLDRLYFKNEKHSFSSGIFLNAFYPFCTSVICGLVICCHFERVVDLIQLPGIFFSALFAQLAATIFSYSFKKMSVKTVVLSSKLADLSIPVALLPWVTTFNFSSYLFAVASTLAFLPIFYSIYKEKLHCNLKNISQIILVLTAQAFINNYFQISKYSYNWMEFIEVLIAILFWRTVFSGFGFLRSRYKSIQLEKIELKLNGARIDSNTAAVMTGANHKILTLRSLLAFISQGAFFYSITRHSGNSVWPILNSTPLIASFLAAKILRERFGKFELVTTILFFTITIVYTTNT